MSIFTNLKNALYSTASSVAMTAANKAVSIASPVAKGIDYIVPETNSTDKALSAANHFSGAAGSAAAVVIDAGYIAADITVTGAKVGGTVCATYAGVSALYALNTAATAAAWGVSWLMPATTAAIGGINVVTIATGAAVYIPTILAFTVAHPIALLGAGIGAGALYSLPQIIDATSKTVDLVKESYNLVKEVVIGSVETVETALIVVKEGIEALEAAYSRNVTPATVESFPVEIEMKEIDGKFSDLFFASENGTIAKFESSDIEVNIEVLGHDDLELSAAAA